MVYNVGYGGASSYGESTMTKQTVPEFKAGELVQVRSWEDMGKEYGFGDYGDTTNPRHVTTPGIGFNEKMRYLCGKKGRITKITFSGGLCFVCEFAGLDLSFPSNPSINNGTGVWYITNFMVEKVLPTENCL